MYVCLHTFVYAICNPCCINFQSVSNGSSIPEYHSHIHHHINQHSNNENECTDRNQSYRDVSFIFHFNISFDVAIRYIYYIYI